MPQISKVGKMNTTVHDNEKYTVVQYYETDVVKFNDDKIILNTGGWETKATMLRMNQVSNEYKLGFRVMKLNNKFDVSYNGFTYKFKNNKCIINREK